MNEPVVQPAGNYFDKYGTRNPIARYLMKGFLDTFDALAAASRVDRALEIGCGEGELSIRLARKGWKAEGCDIAPNVVAEATRRARRAALDIRFSTCRIQDALGCFEPANFVVCCEVLEHLEYPREGLRVLEALSTEYVLVSVPREPIWRLLNMVRLKYLPNLGNTPGHIQHWSRRRFVEMLSERFDVVDVRSPLPWTMVLCRVRR
ncbi:Methyltransferase domain-containing protein [Luteibacter sp. UNCMF331Sha3.1]|uniref:class I SAM-dependent methyltransferase n=1 Tax=Luteibacter sp. UNCMF331Sha3.1 TaxID=1502760 RepID=UPI0008CCB583|nr:methyltransferase domain-containing protein [Luteibacter sp. UNCMF331Sha3.1]SEM33899.1 Methyltransferase domain-containing protein [Luteibacter sp. UNCMF331Sha3.1]